MLRYIVKDDDLGANESVGHDHDLLFAGGGYFREGALANFLTEMANPLNNNRYIHTKSLLVDPMASQLGLGLRQRDAGGSHAVMARGVEQHAAESTADTNEGGAE